MRSPVACANLRVPPRTVHVDERHCWLCSMQCHDLAAKRGGLQQRDIVKLLAEAPALAGWRNGELSERPRMRLAEKFDFGRGIGSGQRDGGDDFTTDLANQADTARNALLGVGHRLVRCPVAQAARGVWSIRSVDELGKRMQIICFRNAPDVQVV